MDDLLFRKGFFQHIENPPGYRPGTHFKSSALTGSLLLLTTAMPVKLKPIMLLTLPTILSRIYPLYSLFIPMPSPIILTNDTKGF